MRSSCDAWASRSVPGMRGLTGRAGGVANCAGESDVETAREGEGVFGVMGGGGTEAAVGGGGLLLLFGSRANGRRVAGAAGDAGGIGKRVIARRGRGRERR